ncbi:MAG: enoyl-CoA hydratase/isomerase family protein [Alphaproteobacteria bacterium]|nr:enoyl-CoA hydratase/isomerase family protein [Alphaproteobacteria bacterium]
MIESKAQNGIGWITLNRPEALNALSLAMIRDMTQLLKTWETDPSITTVLIQGAGGKAFCAGGDVRAVYEAQKAGDVATCDTFFREEYTLNTFIHSSPKPYVALIDGLALGGGLGVSVNGSHRIVSERALLAMPETGIGFFPDVGGTTFLTRGPSPVGLYVGLTGTPLKARDALWFGLATHFVRSSNLPSLKAELEHGGELESLLSHYTQDPEEKGLLETHREPIEAHFKKASLREIFEGLAEDPSPFAQNTLNILKTKSPTSLAVTFRQLRRPPRSFVEGIKQEFRLSQRMVMNHDFREGIRAVLVDKDRLPRWKPLRIEELTEQDIDAFFAPLERELIL